MRANVTTQKTTKLGKPIAWPIASSAQLSAEITAVSSKRQMAFRMCMAGAPGSGRMSTPTLLVSPRSKSTTVNRCFGYEVFVKKIPDMIGLAGA
jgi:hypothetical protein